jgi:hypothetical protein
METVQKMAPIAKTCKGKFSTDLTMKAILDQHMQPDLNTLTGGHVAHEEREASMGSSRWWTSPRR